MTKRQKRGVQACACLLTALLLLAGGAPARGEEWVSDFSSLAWTDAFARLHARLSQEYAFTDWKGIRWQALGDAYGPKIDQAQAADDFEAYYLALRAYLHEIPDGHVSVTNLVEIDEKYVGAGFGFSAAALDDGQVIAAWVDEASPAWAAGLRPGNELLSWNGAPVQSALEKVSTLFDGNSATLEDLRVKKVQYLTRAPLGTQVDLVYRGGEDGQPTPVALTAYDDGGLSLKKGYPGAIVSDRLRDLIRGLDPQGPLPEAMVEQKLLEGNIGYIKVWGEIDADLQGTGAYASTLSLFRQAVKAVEDAGCGGLILDLRNNVGGEDAMAAAMLGSFYPEKAFYEYQNAYDPVAGTRSIQVADAATGSPALWIDPAELVYTGRVIALINQKCISSGEGLALGIRNLPKGETLGFFGTNGSFGLCGPEAAMPVGLTVHWPSGQSLDENRQIQLDSRDGIGGVAPTLPVPMTRENALRVARGEDVELEEAIRRLTQP